MDKMSLSFKADPRLIGTLKHLAKKENRSLANYVVTVLIKHLEEKGIEWQKEKKGK